MTRFNEWLMEKEKGLDTWDDESLKKFAKTIGKEPKEKGFFDACVKRMSKHFSEEDVKGFCAKVKDKGWDTTLWRGKDKTKKEVEKLKKEED